jgi:hypothetical protein
LNHSCGVEIVIEVRDATLTDWAQMGRLTVDTG